MRSALAESDHSDVDCSVAVAADCPDVAAAESLGTEAVRPLDSNCSGSARLGIEAARWDTEIVCWGTEIVRLAVAAAHWDTAGTHRDSEAAHWDTEAVHLDIAAAHCLVDVFLGHSGLQAADCPIAVVHYLGTESVGHEDTVDLESPDMEVVDHLGIEAADRPGTEAAVHRGTEAAGRWDAGC